MSYRTCCRVRVAIVLTGLQHFAHHIDCGHLQKLAQTRGIRDLVILQVQRRQRRAATHRRDGSEPAQAIAAGLQGVQAGAVLHALEANQTVARRIEGGQVWDFGEAG